MASALALPGLPLAAMYTGTFDPATEAHHAIMRSAVRDHGVKRLIVAVNNVESPKIFKCSAEQRREILLAGLHPDIADRVEIVIEPPEGKNALFERLRQDPRYSWMCVIGADSFEKLPREARDRRRWLVFERGGVGAGGDAPNVMRAHLDVEVQDVAATHARERLEKGESVRGLVRPAAAKLIARRGYYTMLGPAALALRSQHFDKLWAAMAGAQAAMEKPAFVPTQTPEEMPNYLARYLGGKITS